MPLAAENFIQENSGFRTATGTTHDVTLGSGTTAGNTLVVVLSTPGAAPTPPAGFVLAATSLDMAHLNAFVRSEVPASETTWQFTTGASSVYSAWYVAELSNVDLVLPVDVAIGTISTSVANAGTKSAGTTGTTVGTSTVAFAAWESTQAAGEAHAWDGYTNDFEEVSDPVQSTAGVHLAVARAFKNEQVGTYQTTATFSTGGAAAPVQALTFALRAADANIVATLTKMWGFDWLTIGGCGNTGATSITGASVSPIGGTWNTNVRIEAGSARNSAAGLRITQTGAAAYLNCAGFGSTAQGAAWGFNVRVRTATGTVVVSEIGNSGDNLQLVYDASTTKYGLRWGPGGTVSWEAGTTPLNTWRWFDARAKFNTDVFHADWRIETGADTYTNQTSPADSTGQMAGMPFDQLLLGGNAAQTMDTDYDDVVLCPYYAAYPLGPHEIRLLTVDPAGTPSVSGTSANFSVFTANGTLAAWNAVNARNAVDEVPPTVSASSDGVVQTATAASDYMQFPMQTYTLAADEVIAAVRFYASEWGGTGAGTGTLGFRGHDGTTEVTFIAASSSYDADSLTAISATYPRWATAMWLQVPNWRQSQLDAAALRVGFSTDAAPDMGISAIYLEVAIRKTQPESLFGEPGGVYVTCERDPVTNGIVSFTVETPVGQGATVNYEVDGTPQTPVVVAADATQTVQVNAISFVEINKVELIPDEPA